MEQSLGNRSDFLNSSQSAQSATPESDNSKIKRKNAPSKTTTDQVESKTSIQRKFEGSPWYREKKMWMSNIRKHRKDIKAMKPVVDDKPPKLDVMDIYDAEIVKTIQNYLTDLFTLNTNMAKTLHDVNVLGGRTVTLQPPKRGVYPSNYKSRREDAKDNERLNKLLKQAIKNAKPKLPTAKQYAEKWEKTLTILDNMAQFPLYWKVEQKEAAKEIPPPQNYVKPYITEKSAKYPDKRPRVFIEVSVKNGAVVGRMTAVLYSDYVPMTVKNFLAFIDPKADLTYKGNFFYLIFPNYYCQTGDVVENKGYGGTSIYGPYFGNEDLTLKHSERGNLTMFSKVPNRNSSQFLITFRKLESLDGHNVVFGKIIKGLHILDAIEGVGSKKTGRPKVEMYISDCDEI